ncbi:type II toxin-antitoxin system HicA family toxin [Pseudothermotoga elfii]|jgi:predicted RNA binding protein YcfA (HicA-like mRNA interferase family)|uniref:type II toxin-antitoxin system HicA family toxin n=1 Tax=Pseudothermotoga elfii TaxID=38322 RepID=UPI000417B74E|nr:type II toxin-antitoxin system HicA family toxin [Pseudothermotoga elfii]
MAKLPRNLSGRELAKLLNGYGYEITRKSGSHLRLSSNIMGYEHRITIPDHSYLKIGTLNNNIAEYLKIPKERLINELFSK